MFNRFQLVASIIKCYGGHGKIKNGSTRCLKFNSISLNISSDVCQIIMGTIQGKGSG